jgi:DNA adenine methylase
LLIKALLPWYGSKRRLATAISRQLGPHVSYWEPFCGSLAVLLAKPLSAHEHVNDLHGDLINLARVLQNEDLAVSLYARLSQTLCHEDLFAECRDWWLVRGQAAEAPDLERAYRYFVVSWMGRNGVSGTERQNHSYSVCWKKQGASRATRFHAAVRSIPAWHERLRRVVVLRRDGLTLLEKIEDRKGVAIYVDPPYLMSTRAQTGGGGFYEHDLADTDHLRLAEVLGRFRRARVLVSYYEHPILSTLYPDWSCLPCPLPKYLSATAGRLSAAGEVLLLNGPPAERDLFTALNELP